MGFHTYFFLLLGEMAYGDEWNGLADLLAGLIEKYADVLDIDSLPDPKEKKNLSEFIDLKCESVEIKEAA